MYCMYVRMQNAFRKRFYDIVVVVVAAAAGGAGAGAGAGVVVLNPIRYKFITLSYSGDES